MKKGMFKKALLVIPAAILAMLAGLYFWSVPIIELVLERIYGVDITYRDPRVIPPYKKIMVRDLRVIDKKSGLAMVALHAAVEPLKIDLFTTKEIDVKFGLYGVNLLKEGYENPANYDSISLLVMTPFDSRWVYHEISGSVKASPKVVDIEEVNAESDYIRIKFSGVIKEEDVDADIRLSFSGAFVKKLPEELTNVILKDEKDGWKNFSVHLKGNYRSPSIQVSGKLFRLNIGAVSESKSSPPTSSNTQS